MRRSVYAEELSNLSRGPLGWAITRGPAAGEVMVEFPARRQRLFSERVLWRKPVLKGKCIMEVAFYNIEKCGESSDPEKKMKVDEFLAKFLWDFECDIVFLAEVHAARVDDFVNHIQAMKPKYHVESAYGFGSCNYVWARSKFVSVTSVDDVGPRPLIIFAKTGEPAVGVIHAKSGQNALTVKQLEYYALLLETNSAGMWALTGDLNYDEAKFERLTLPVGAHGGTVWEITQHKGGCLDWAILGAATRIKLNTFRTAKANMQGELLELEQPDHAPVFFDFD